LCSVPQPVAEPAPDTKFDGGDAELIRRAHEAKNGPKFARLWAGDTRGYRSPSEADITLCLLLGFWCGRDPARIDRLFRRSGLMR
jgi:primase-polymerase (primpol)-like protein